MLLAMHAPQATGVYTGIPKDNSDNLPEKFMETEQAAFKARVSEKEADIMAAERLAMFQMQREYIDDPDKWWNRLVTMTEPEMKLMPMGFIRKYGSYLTNIQRNHRDFHLSENKNIYDYFQQVKNIKKL